MAATDDECPARCLSFTVVAPVAAAKVKPVCRRSCRWRSVRPTKARALPGDLEYVPRERYAGDTGKDERVGVRASKTTQVLT
jgi:hypothetical protein